MNESSVRIARSSGFTVVQNAAVRDARLSLAATGLYVRLMSLPENKSRGMKYIQKLAGCGRDKLREIFRELESAGYLVREQTHAADGKFATYSYALFDSPQAPVTENPATAEPATENPATAEPATAGPATVLPSPKEITRDINNPPKSPQGESAALFERFWALYPRKQGKRKAQASWDKLKPDLALCHRMSAALKRQMRDESWQRDSGRYVPMPATWLNQARWEDELPALREGPGHEAAEAERKEAFGVWT